MQSVQPIIQSLSTLAAIHENLLDISGKKTDLLKKGEIDDLQSLLVREQKQIRELEQMEQKRQDQVQAWFTAREPAEEQATITSMLEYIKEEEAKQDLEQTAVRLTDTITQLKHQEQLNQELMKQSMQFVQLSLDMMNPSINHMNYGGGREAGVESKRSVFDSKA